MVIAKGHICTDDVETCTYNASTNSYDIVYKNGKCYPYSAGNVIFMENPIKLDPKNYIIETQNGKYLYDIKQIYEFTGPYSKYWHIIFANFVHNYKKDDLIIQNNCLTDKKSGSTFDYLREISGLCKLPDEYKDEEVILKKYFENIGFVSDETVLSLYLNPNNEPIHRCEENLIFPFGCNQSQYDAVRNALENQISVIQGPPGTGKTQTILNIISNLIIKRKSVLVVSNNNSAIKNVLEKLSKTKYGMDFLVAPLGSVANKEMFIENQNGVYPDLSLWKSEINSSAILQEISEISSKLEMVYGIKETLARLKEKRYNVELEAKHFDEFADETGALYKTVKIRDNLSSEKIMHLWQELQRRTDESKKMSILFKLKSIFLYGIANWDFYKQDISKIISVLQGMYYQQSLKEIDNKIENFEKDLDDNKGDFEKQLGEKSLKCLKSAIEERYNWKCLRSIFTKDDLFKSPSLVMQEYPIILSTTYSARNSLNVKDVQYDYVIMDEASQVDLATGALALSCAKNAVIVGDLKQLPNVIKSDVRKVAEQIMAKYNIPKAYDFACNSFLQSVISAIPNIPSVLLREHYRCHPQIISFCNQKFYDGDLIVMTEDDNLGKALMAIKTVVGNHARDNYNQRQIDVIKEEILPTLDVPNDEIGIITPYNAQVNAIKRQIPEIDVATVHKFQGREKDVIILSTVDNQINDFTDDPYLLNVAVSRAKKRLIVVISGNEQDKKGNIFDLISYIQYNKMEVVDSKVYSIFDFLYSQYKEQRWKYLKDKKRISEYYSENRAYNFILDLIKDHKEYSVVCFEPLSMIVRDMSGLTDKEVRYLMNPATHVDFMIYNKVNKQPVVAIEIDGYSFHKEGTVQHVRDKLKDHILEVSGIGLLRLNTNGSGEKEKVLKAIGIE
ncbi:Superfamily I DNA and/or RNA helicase [Oribacterium sp. KHPX15]|nr:Superfamily I DNA and/or RNA helicase [Oribacterium sp. KHPX15]